jgi:hypothetical protein
MCQRKELPRISKVPRSLTQADPDPEIKMLNQNDLNPVQSTCSFLLENSFDFIWH